MYFSFQSDSVAYTPEKTKFWAMLLTREWNIKEVNGLQVEPEVYFKEKYGIILDTNRNGTIVGIEVPDHMYTLMLLKI
jgi:hypothetical protein